MAFDFPASPTVGQAYTLNGVSYVWNGYAWAAASPSPGVPLTDVPIDGKTYARKDAAWLDLKTTVYEVSRPKAWMMVNAVGVSAIVGTSLNVGSITDTGVGTFLANYTATMKNAGTATTAGSGGTGAGAPFITCAGGQSGVNFGTFSSQGWGQAEANAASVITCAELA